MRKWVVLAAGLSVLALTNYTIYSKEQLLSQGRVVLLELAPVDPRSLMQGDYMALRFRVANDISTRHSDTAGDGHVVLKLDAHGVGSFVRLDDGAPLAADEVRLRYRIRNGEVRLASNAFFFEEGSGALYQAARYGEFRADASGDAILTGLRGQELAQLGSPARH